MYDGHSFGFGGLATSLRGSRSSLPVLKNRSELYETLELFHPDEESRERRERLRSAVSASPGLDVVCRRSMSIHGTTLQSKKMPSPDVDLDVDDAECTGWAIANRLHRREGEWTPRATYCFVETPPRHILKAPLPQESRSRTPPCGFWHHQH
jgi:hypothetical protein